MAASRVRKRDEAEARPVAFGRKGEHRRRVCGVRGYVTGRLLYLARVVAAVAVPLAFTGPAVAAQVAAEVGACSGVGGRACEVEVVRATGHPDTAALLLHLKVVWVWLV